MSTPAQFPKKGEHAVFCEHISNGGEWPRMRGAHVIRILPDQMLSPGELEHDWLFVCGACRNAKKRDPAAKIEGFRWTLQRDLPPPALRLFGVAL